jgi:type IV pilus assembly protein PilB
MEQAVGMGASDIHIEPLMSQVRIRMRVDGILNNILQTPIGTLNAMIARVKILGGLNIAERRAPQDGRFNMRVLEREIDVRLSVMPTVHGEKAVMRILDRSTFLIPKARLGFTEKNLAAFNSLLKTPHGIILLTGPTGSGKSTTLYTMLDEINNVRDNIVTIEDPVEYMIDGLNQTQVNPRAGMDFANGLRSILRQDPDIIMVGEIRDAQTVEIAIRAAITGHLVLSTIHTNDAVSTVFRLTDMGIPAYMVAASVVGIIGQRLLRVICPHCKTEYSPTQTELEMAGLETWSATDAKFHKGQGCAECNQTGYKGRMAVHEILIFDNTFRDLVHNNAPVSELRKYALQTGMTPLRDSALELLGSGVTTIDEIINITHGV